MWVLGRLACQERQGDAARRRPGLGQHCERVRQRIDLVVLAAEWEVAQLLKEGVVPSGADNGEVACLNL